MNRTSFARRAGLAVGAIALLAAVTLPTVASACAFCGTYRVVGVEVWDVLNIRSGPSVRFQVVGAMPPDAVGVVITGPCEGNWCRISYFAKSGWVNTNYLAVVN
ncbi:MAG: SH3 domain-containing protein [Hyphomicrobiales bacterium]